MLIEEIWKSVDGFEHYEISNFGRVKSKQRKILKFRGFTQHLKTVNERIMKPALTSNGYLFLVLMHEGIKKSVWIHKEVAKCFISGRKKGLVVHHLNGIKTDNHYWNLEYVSMQKNTNEYYKSIGKSKGKIPYSEIPKIIDLINNGYVIKDLAEKYNVSRNDMATISKIIDCSQELNTAGLLLITHYDWSTSDLYQKTICGIKKPIGFIETSLNVVDVDCKRCLNALKVSLIKDADKAVSSLKNIIDEIKAKGLKVCSNCGCTIYPDKPHIC